MGPDGATDGGAPVRSVGTEREDHSDRLGERGRTAQGAFVAGRDGVAAGEQGAHHDPAQRSNPARGLSCLDSTSARACPNRLSATESNEVRTTRSRPFGSKGSCAQYRGISIALD